MYMLTVYIQMALTITESDGTKWAYLTSHRNRNCSRLFTTVNIGIYNSTNRGNRGKMESKDGRPEFCHNYRSNGFQQKTTENCSTVPSFPPTSLRPATNALHPYSARSSDSARVAVICLPLLTEAFSYTSVGTTLKACPQVAHSYGYLFFKDGVPLGNSSKMQFNTAQFNVRAVEWWRWSN